MSHRKSNMLTELKRQIENEILQIERRQDLSADEKVNKIIYTTAAICAGVAIQPIPFADMPILTAIQAFMGHKIGKVRGVNIAEEGVWEVIKAIGGVVGLGFAAQQTAIGLYKLGLPFLGGLMTVPLVGGLTVAIGRAMDVYFVMKAQGREPSPEAIKRAFNQGKQEGKKIKPRQTEV
ncbi:MAG: DUF697 domain-containing protein [Thermacetogeniaceae bacterium]|nr:DUF697 domain-containing protein [Thermoanaerobacterales bacterium]